ncbi:MAG TPA: hypothetical protein VGF86_05350 [Candidatus Tumulicola sp.]
MEGKIMLRYTLSSLVLAVALTAAPVAGLAQDSGVSDAQYMAQVMSAAPASVVKGATVVRMNADGTMRTLQTGSDGFTCMVAGPNAPMCADKNAIGWLHAYLTHATPPSDVGLVYMLGGDEGASNTDPAARAKTDSNHWVVTGAHIMIVGPNVNSMGYPMTADADPTKPYVMWAGTPYSHVMFPVAASP